MQEFYREILSDKDYVSERRKQLRKAAGLDPRDSRVSWHFLVEYHVNACSCALWWSNFSSYFGGSPPIMKHKVAKFSFVDVKRRPQGKLQHTQIGERVAVWHNMGLVHDIWSFEYLIKHGKITWNNMEQWKMFQTTNQVFVATPSYCSKVYLGRFFWVPRLVCQRPRG